MTVVEDLLLRLRTSGASEAASSVDRVSRSVSHADKSAKQASKSHHELGKAFGGIRSLAFTAVGAAGLGGLTAGLGESIKNAEQLQESQAQLGASIHANVRSPARDATKQMSEFADSLSMRGGFGPTQDIQGMTQFLRVTHDTAKAQTDMTLATNIARGAHVDLGRAVKAVMQAENGRTTGLVRLGVTVPKVTTALDELHATHKKATAEQIAAAKATDALANKQGALANASKEYSGGMATYSHTAAGGIANLRNTIEVLSTKLGTVLLPIVQKVTGFISKFVDQMLHGTGAGGKLMGTLKEIAKYLEQVWKWVKQNKDLVEALAVAIGAVVLAYKAWKIATELLNAVSDMNPWVLAIMAVVFVVVLLYTRFKWFRDFVKTVMRDAAAAFEWLKNAAVDVFGWIKQHWPILVGILLGPIAFAVAEIIKHFDTVKKIPGKIVHAFLAVGQAIANAIVWPFKWAFNWVKKHLPSFHVHHIGPIPIPLPSFPGLAAGGTTPYGGAFVVGERGPELVTLPQGASVSSQDDLRSTNQLLRELIIAVQQNSQMLVVDGKVLAQSVMRQGLLQQSRS